MIIKATGYWETCKQCGTTYQRKWGHKCTFPLEKRVALSEYPGPAIHIPEGGDT